LSINPVKINKKSGGRVLKRRGYYSRGESFKDGGELFVNAKFKV